MENTKQYQHHTGSIATIAPASYERDGKVNHFFKVEVVLEDGSKKEGAIFELEKFEVEDANALIGKTVNVSVLPAQSEDGFEKVYINPPFVQKPSFTDKNVLTPDSIYTAKLAKVDLFVSKTTKNAFVKYIIDADSINIAPSPKQVQILCSTMDMNEADATKIITSKFAKQKASPLFKQVDFSQITQVSSIAPNKNATDIIKPVVKEDGTTFDILANNIKNLASLVFTQHNNNPDKKYNVKLDTVVLQLTNDIAKTATDDTVVAKLKEQLQLLSGLPIYIHIKKYKSKKTGAIGQTCRIMGKKPKDLQTAEEQTVGFLR